jgi:D-tyrosyl-tRNA(Tyr) deacylase
VRVIAQRVASASVMVGEETVGAIDHGLLLLVGVEETDSEVDVNWLSAKLSKLRIFPDAAGVMNRNVSEVGGQVLAVSQFTLFASIRKGNRPSWSRAARGDVSQPLFERFVRQLETDLGIKVETGVFGADMRVNLTNDGPVTLFIDSKAPE